jgi:type II secretory pathway pseudopilin PulG
MRTTAKIAGVPLLKRAAFTLAEVCVSAAIAAVVIGAIIYGYVMASTRADWSALSLAAESLAVQGMEQLRACKYDPKAAAPVDQLVAANFPPQTNMLDLPVSGTNVVWATNFFTIATSASMPNVKCLRVDCVWRWPIRAALFTNTIVTYRGPDS